MEKQKREFNIKKSISPLIASIIALILVLLIFSVSLYVYILDSSYLINLIILIIISIFLLFIIIFLTIYLSIPKKLVDYSNPSFIIIYKTFRKIKLEYKDIFAIYSSSHTYSFLNNGYCLIYLNNGKIIKVKFIEHPNELYLLINSKISENHFYLIGKENKFTKFFIRIYNLVFTFTSSLLPLHKSEILDSLEEIPLKYIENNNKKVFILSSNTIYKLGHLNNLLDSFNKHNLSYVIYNVSLSNPDIDSVLKAKEEYLSNNCDSLLAIGGGSIIDLAKALGVTLTNKKDLINYTGLFKVKKKIPLLIAIPTIISSASETTSSSVITFEEGKFAITSFKIVPSYTYLGDEFLSTIPIYKIKVGIIDSFIHALEAYLNVFKNKKYDKYALDAMKKIIVNINELLTFEKNNKEIPMSIINSLAIANYEAGIAFSYKGVGYIYALSHALSYKYHLDHAYTNGILLPEVLKTYRYNKKALNKMSFLYFYLIQNKTYKEIKVNKDLVSINANKFIDYLINLISSLGINNNLKDKIKPEDIKDMAYLAKKESNLNYGTPIHYSLEWFIMIYINLSRL